MIKVPCNLINSIRTSFWLRVISFVSSARTKLVVYLCTLTGCSWDLLLYDYDLQQTILWKWTCYICCHLTEINHHPTAIIIQGCQKVSVFLEVEEGLIEGGVSWWDWVNLVVILHIPEKTENLAVSVSTELVIVNLSVSLST